MSVAQQKRRAPGKEIRCASAGRARGSSVSCLGGETVGAGNGGRRRQWRVERTEEERARFGMPLDR
jgi:hypothetical protein